MSLVLNPEGPIQAQARVEPSALKVYGSGAFPGTLSAVMLGADGSGPVRAGLRLDRDQVEQLCDYLDAWLAGLEAMDE